MHDGLQLLELYMQRLISSATSTVLVVTDALHASHPVQRIADAWGPDLVPGQRHQLRGTVLCVARPGCINCNYPLLCTGPTGPVSRGPKGHNATARRFFFGTLRSQLQRETHLFKCCYVYFHAKAVLKTPLFIWTCTSVWPCTSVWTCTSVCKCAWHCVCVCMCENAGAGCVCACVHVCRTQRLPLKMLVLAVCVRVYVCVCVHVCMCMCATHNGCP